jgi:hypothetical protein
VGRYRDRRRSIATKLPLSETDLAPLPATWGTQMPILVDSRRIDAEHRRESVHEAFSSAGRAGDISVIDLAGHGYARVEAATFGPAQIFQIHGTDVSVRRTSHHVKTFEDLPAVSIVVPGSGAVMTQAGQLKVIRPGQAFVLDRSVPSQVRWVGDSLSFNAPYQEFGLSLDLIRIAAGRLSSSPLCGIVADHLVRLGRDADVVSGDSSAAEIGVSAIQMIRALLISAVGNERRVGDAKGEALLVFILAYIRQHLTELDLTSIRIARAHNISLRHLYALCCAADIRIAEWILE